MMAKKAICSDQLFKGRHFEREIIILCVRWYLRFKLSFRRFKRAAVTIAGIELLHRIRKGQFDLGSLDAQGQAAPAIRTAVLSV